MAVARDIFGEAVQAFRLGTTQTVSVGASFQDVTLDGLNGVVRVVSTVDCHLKHGTGAVAGDAFLPAGVIEYFSYKSGDVLSFIQDSASGTAYVTEMK